MAQGLARSVAAPRPARRTRDRPRQTAAPAPGPDQAQSGTHPRACPGTPRRSRDPPTSPYGTAPPYGSPADATLADHASAQPGGPAPGDPSVGTQPAAPTAGGPVDYSHPGRQTTAPPPPPPTAPPAQPGQPAQPVAGDATGWSMEERLYNQVWGMFEDLARTTAAYRSAVDFAESRMEQELDKVLADPRSRIGGQGDAAREAARAKHAQLVDQARAALDRDLAQLAAEAEVVEPALPPAYARWDNPVWHGYRVPMEIPMALRLGDLHLPESDGCASRCWSGCRWSAACGSTAAAPARRRLVRRLRRAAPPRAGHGGGARRPAARRLPAGRVHRARHRPGRARRGRAGAAGAARVCSRPRPPPAPRVSRTSWRGSPSASTWCRWRCAAARPTRCRPGFDTAEQLLIVNDFPHGFDDRAVTQLRYLADEGPAVGVHLMMVADREDAAAYGPLLDPLWRSLLRLTPVPDDHLADPWVGHAWTYEPSLVPPGSQVLQQVLAQVAAARRSWNR